MAHHPPPVGTAGERPDPTGKPGRFLFSGAPGPPARGETATYPLPDGRSHPPAGGLPAHRGLRGESRKPTSWRRALSVTRMSIRKSARDVMIESNARAKTT